MKLKTTLILLVVFAALLGVVLFVDSKGEKKKAAEKKTNTLIDVAAGDVHKASLVRGLETLAFERDEAGAWLLTSPLRAAADQFEVDGFIGALASLRIERVVEAEAKDPSAYEIPKTEVSLWVKDGETPIKLLVGMENPLDKSLFAKREDDPRIVLLSSTLKTTLDKRIFDFREKEVFKFTPADVRTVRVRAKDAAWQAVREEGGWMLRAPVAALAAKGRIDSLLDSLAGLRAAAFVAEDKTPTALAEFGLDKPDYEVTLSLPAAGQEIVFSLHKKGEASYAANSRSTKIITFEGTLLSDLDRKVEEMREKKVADFYSWNASRIALKRDGAEIAVVKDKSGLPEKWVFDDPAKAEADRAKVDDFVRKIEALEASGFVDDPGPLAAYGLEPGAEVRIRAKDAQDKDVELVIFVGREDAERKEVLVKTPELPYLFRVDSAFLQDWPKERKDWQAAAPEIDDSKLEKK